MALPGELTSQTTQHASAHSRDYDVKAFFGAVWDGATNDSVKVQDAIDAAYAAGGGRVRLPRGEGRANVTLKPRVHLVGEGIGVTTMKAVAGSNADVVKGLNFATLTGKSYASGDYALGAYEAGISNMTIDGDKATQSAGYGIRIWGRAPRFESIDVRGCKSGGIWTEFTEVDSFTDPAQVLEGYGNGIQVHDIDGHGWVHRGPHDFVTFGFAVWDVSGWGVRVEQVVGSYNGGMTFHTPNAYMTGQGGAYASGSLKVYGGALGTDIGFGPGVEFAALSGSHELNGVALYGDTALILRGTNHRVDVLLATSTIGIELDGVAGCLIRASSFNIPTVLNVISETGPSKIQIIASLPSGGTLRTGAALTPSDTVDIRGWGGENLVEFSLPTDVLKSVNGYSPILPTSQLMMVAPDLTTVFQALQTFVSGNLAIGTAVFHSGAGSPEGSKTAVPGSVYLNLSGGANTTLYVKESGTGNTGWIAK